MFRIDKHPYPPTFSKEDSAIILLCNALSSFRGEELVFLLGLQPPQVTQFTLQPKIAFLCGLAISECLLLQALYAFEHMRERFHPLRSSESSQPAIHLIASLLPQVSV